jgi:hypothetical protein
MELTVLSHQRKEDREYMVVLQRWPNASVEHAASKPGPVETTIDMLNALGFHRLSEKGV